MARIAIVSFRLGLDDGVSIEATKWKNAFLELGHDVREVAGEGFADVILPGLAIHATSAPTPFELHAALEDADLVVVENLASLPLNLRARDALYEVLHTRLVLFHHHDLAWQREQLSHLEGPRDEPTWFHVTINELSRRELKERGIEASVLANTFDCDPPQGQRFKTRQSLGIDEERLVLMPTRALPRKNVAGALRLCEQLGAVFWILGPSEDGYDRTLEQLLDATSVEVRRGLHDGSIHDAYAASDLVVMPSTWEGFGNPVLESVTHRRALALNVYPVAREIIAHGFEFFELDDVSRIATFLDDPDEGLFERNLAIAREHFNLRDLAPQLAQILRMMGVKPSPLLS